jgi:hypothetical protein
MILSFMKTNSTHLFKSVNYPPAARVPAPLAALVRHAALGAIDDLRIFRPAGKPNHPGHEFAVGKKASIIRLGLALPEPYLRASRKA